MKIRIIGIGGIGTWLCDALFKYLNYNVASTGEEIEVTLCDGDSFESKNSERQSFEMRALHINKAQAKAAQLAPLYPNVKIEIMPEYINEINVCSILPADFIFICVDQHASRKIIGEAIQNAKPENITVISGGNELDYGTVITHIRRKGEDITPPITSYDEIKNADMNEHPDRMSCAQLAVSAPQVIFVNMAVAVSMCNTFYSILAGKVIGYNRVDLDIVQNGAKPNFKQEIAKKYMAIAV